MAKTEKRRQKQLAKRKAKRNEKRRATTKAKNRGLAERILAFRHAPVLDCRITPTDSGMCSVMVSREANGMVGFAVFLVDLYCLGVKDAWGRVVPKSEYREVAGRFRQQQPTRDIDAPSARKLVEDAIEFARSLGFSPAGDYRRLRGILEGIDPGQAREEFEMGRNGKPAYISGPHDDPAFVEHVMRTLNGNSGPDNDATITLNGSLAPLIEVEKLDDDLDEDDVCDDDWDQAP